MQFLLRCPKCKQKMKYEPMGKDKILSGKSKQCVYCGKSFKVTENIVHKL